MTEEIRFINAAGGNVKQMPRITIAVLLLCGSTVLCQHKPFVRVRWNDAKVHIVYKGKAMEYNFRNAQAVGPGKPYSALYLADIDSVKTMYLAENNGAVSMLLNIAGPSRGQAAASSFCGAGMERALVLFKFDQQGEIEKPSVVLYESCLATIEPKAGDEDAPHAEEDGEIVTTFVYFRELKKYDLRKPPPNDAFAEVTVHVSFDPAKLDRGLVIKENCRLRDSSAACPSAQ
jgi:hypothetical protein